MSKHTVLVVEDEVLILNNICTILQMFGYHCITANNGLQALDALKNATPHLILCDVMMPEMNGFELLQTILANTQTQQIPFCFLTARADVVDINYGLSTGAKGYITKPFLAKDLLHTVQNLLSSTH